MVQKSEHGCNYGRLLSSMLGVTAGDHRCGFTNECALRPGTSCLIPKVSHLRCHVAETSWSSDDEPINSFQQMSNRCHKPGHILTRYLDNFAGPKVLLNALPAGSLPTQHCPRREHERNEAQHNRIKAIHQQDFPRNTYRPFSHPSTSCIAYSPH